jgi:hypothetical protein
VHCGSGVLVRGVGAVLVDFAEFAGLDVVDEAAHRDLGNERMVLDAGDLAADVAFEIDEGMEVIGRDGGETGLLFQSIEELVVGESDHAAIGVIDDDELLGAEQVMGDDQGAEGVFGGNASGVADDVGVAGLEAEELFNVNARVHAGEDGEFAGRGHGKAAEAEFCCVFFIGCENFVGDAHCLDLSF